MRVHFKSVAYVIAIGSVLSLLTSVSVGHAVIVFCFCNLQQPWKDFFSDFGLPPLRWFHLETRMLTNLNYYFFNYVTISFLILFFQMYLFSYLFFPSVFDPIVSAVYLFTCFIVMFVIFIVFT